jgi:hypothetical protein
VTVITLDDIEAHAADRLLPPDPEFAERYAHYESRGRRIAAERTVSFVAICRNAMPWLPRTLALVEQTGSMFRSWSAYIHENDSSDATKDVLAAWHDGGQRVVSLNTYSRPHLNTTTSTARTSALAEYRDACQQWVRSRPATDYVIVFDTDPWGGWSIGGVAESIAELEADRSWYGLASYSWAELPAGLGPAVPIHYDAFAARLNHWARRDQQWFHHWHPAVGSWPVEFHSAFGQLCVYRALAYRAGTYGGDDCEHVVFHRSIARECVGQRLGLNPSSRCVSFWVPNDGQHSND